MQCRFCKEWSNRDAKFCEHCGITFQEFIFNPHLGPFCPSCNFTIQYPMRYCYNCGFNIKLANEVGQRTYNIYIEWDISNIPGLVYQRFSEKNVFTIEEIQVLLMYRLRKEVLFPVWVGGSTFEEGIVEWHQAIWNAASNQYEIDVTQDHGPQGKLQMYIYEVKNF